MPNSTLVNLVRITILNTGTGTLELGAALPAFRGVEALTDGDTYSYSIQQGSNFETGQGVFSQSAGTLTRGVIESSAGNGAINLSPNAVVAFPALAADFQLPGPPGTDGLPGPNGPPGAAGVNGAGINMPVKVVTGDYSLVGSDANTYVRANAIDPLTITLPNAASQGWLVDTVIAIEQEGVGTVAIAAGGGVTVLSRENAMQCAGQYAVIQLKCVAADVWTLLGDAGPFSGGIPDAPSDAVLYGRKNALWEPVPVLEAPEDGTPYVRQDGGWVSGGGGGGGVLPTLRGVTTNIAGGNQISVGLPSGAAVGDYCVFLWSGGNSINEGSMADGFLVNYVSNANGWNGGYATKLLEAADITAGSVTGHFNGSYSNSAACIVFVGDTAVRKAYFQSRYRPQAPFGIEMNDFVPTDYVIAVLSNRGNTAASFASGTSLGSQGGGGCIAVQHLPTTTGVLRFTATINDNGGYDTVQLVIGVGPSQV